MRTRLRTSTSASDLEASVLGDSRSSVPAKLPFSKFRCLWDPQLALDEEKCSPFGRLQVHVDRGTGLLSMDFHNGLSDPYCELFLNGKEETKQRTRVVKKSLSPTWNQHFTFDLYHPLSMLRIKVYDKDFGTQWGILDMFGMDDDFMGWIDINVGALPLNANVSGWFYLNHPHHWAELATGHLESDKPKPAGRIFVTFKLEASPENELYALCLPRPEGSTGTDYKEAASADKFDLGKFVEHAFNVAELLMERFKFVNEAIQDFSTHLSPLKLWALGMLMTWCPDLILPTLLVLIWLLVQWIDGTLAEGISKPKSDEELPEGGSRGASKGTTFPSTATDNLNEDAFERLDSPPSPESMVNHKAALLRERLKAAVARTKFSLTRAQVKFNDALHAPLLPGDEDLMQDVEAGETMIDEPQGMAKLAEEDKKTGHVLGQRLKGFERFLKAEQVAELQNLDETLKNISGSSRRWEAFFREPFYRWLIRATFLGLSASLVVLTFLVRKVEWRLVQISLTVWMCLMLWNNSPFGRLCSGIVQMQRRDRLGFPSDAEQKAELPSPTSLLSPGATLHQAPRTLSAVQVQKVVLGALNHFKHANEAEEDGLAVEPQGPHYHPHQMRVVSVNKPTTCVDCGMFLVGFYNQGYMCEWCHRLVCPVCAALIADDCPKRVASGKLMDSTDFQSFSCCGAGPLLSQSPGNVDAASNPAPNGDSRASEQTASDQPVTS